MFVVLSLALPTKIIEVFNLIQDISIINFWFETESAKLCNNGYCQRKQDR